MSQYLLSLNEDQLAMIDRALTDLEALLVPPADFDDDQALGADLRSIPEGTRSAPTTLAPLRTRLQRLQRLIQHAREAEIILVNDALNRRLMAHAFSIASGQPPGQQQLHGEAPIEVA